MLFWNAFLENRFSTEPAGTESSPKKTGLANRCRKGHLPFVSYNKNGFRLQTAGVFKVGTIADRLTLLSVLVFSPKTMPEKVHKKESGHVSRETIKAYKFL